MLTKESDIFSCGAVLQQLFGFISDTFFFFFLEVWVGFWVWLFKEKEAEKQLGEGINFIHSTAGSAQELTKGIATKDLQIVPE